jgi:hypothetical protein
METNLKELNVEQNELDDFQKVEQKARRLIGGDNPNTTLVAWWDSRRGEGGPREACSEETFSCVSTYAQGHGGRYRVTVNGGKLDLFYTVPEGKYEKLDKEEGREIHREAKTGEVDNIQGG